jgi:O-antigen/teichoic acid export membrane protein
MANRTLSLIPMAGGAAAVPSRDPYAMKITGSLVIKNTVWNLAGSAGPLAVAAIGIPFLVRGLGVDRFALLTIAWTLIGYLSLFDFGLGRALTKLIAEKLAVSDFETIPSAFWDSLLLLLGLGCFGAVVLAASCPWLVKHVLRVPAGMEAETARAFYYIALVIPVVTVATGLRGFLEAGQRFLPVNAVRLLMGTLGVVGPLAVLPFSRDIGVIIGALAVTRVFTSALYLYLCIQFMPALWSKRKIGATPIKPLLHFGGWLTLSNLLSPIMVSMDRFLISWMLSIGVVAYYATPSEMMLKLLAIPAALQTVLFPAFSSAMCSDQAQTRKLYRRGNEATFLSIFPITLVMVLFAGDILRVWLGEEFAVRSALVLQLLSVGILINSVGHIPSILIQSAGRPDLSAKLKLIEIPPYLAITYWMVLRYGIKGAAAAWVLRVLMDSALLFFVSKRWVPGSPFRVDHALIACAAIAWAFVLVGMGMPLGVRAGFGLIVLAVAGKWALPLIENFRQAWKPSY